MSLKTCPQCGEVVPVEALRCKTCLTDLTETRKTRSPGLMIGVMLVIMLMLGAGVFYLAKRQAVTQNVVVDKETSSIVITRKTGEGTDTTRLRFQDVERVELVVGGFAATWAVYLVQAGDQRLLLRATSDEDLSEYAQHVASIMNKPLVEDRKVSGMRQGLPDARWPGQDKENDKGTKSERKPSR